MGGKRTDKSIHILNKCFDNADKNNKIRVKGIKKLQEEDIYVTDSTERGKQL